MVPQERAGCEYGRVGGHPAYGRDYRFSGLVQSNLLPALHRLESTVRYLGIEVDDALEISEQTEI